MGIQHCGHAEEECPDRVCINFTNLNKVCPIYPYQLPRISNIIDVTSGYQCLSFLNAFLGCSQIPMYEFGQMNASFIIDEGLSAVERCHSDSIM